LRCEGENIAKSHPVNIAQLLKTARLKCRDIYELRKNWTINYTIEHWLVLDEKFATSLTGIFKV